MSLAQKNWDKIAALLEEQTDLDWLDYPDDSWVDDVSERMIMTAHALREFESYIF